MVFFFSNPTIPNSNAPFPRSVMMRLVKRVFDDFCSVRIFPELCDDRAGDGYWRHRRCRY